MRLKWSKEYPTPPNWVPSFYRHSLFAYWRNIVQFIRILYWKYFSRFVDNNVRKSVSDVDHCYRIYIPCLIKEFSLKPLSLPSIGASLCLREAGEREKWKRGAHDGKRKERKPFSSTYRSHMWLLFFYFCYFYWGTQREPLWHRQHKPSIQRCFDLLCCGELCCTAIELLIKNILPFPHKDVQGKKDFTTGHPHPLPLLRFYNIWPIPFQCSCLQDLFPSNQVASPSFCIKAVWG